MMPGKRRPTDLRSMSGLRRWGVVSFSHLNNVVHCLRHILRNADRRLAPWFAARVLFEMLQIGPGNDQDGKSSKSSNEDRRVNNEPPGDVKPKSWIDASVKVACCSRRRLLGPANGRQCSYGANKTPTPINTMPMAMISRSTVSHSGMRMAWSLPPTLSVR